MHKTGDRDSERINREIEIETHFKRQILNRAIESKRSRHENLGTRGVLIEVFKKGSLFTVM